MSSSPPYPVHLRFHDPRDPAQRYADAMGVDEPGPSGAYDSEEREPAYLPLPSFSISEEKEQSLRELYASLDTNRDGRIDIRELTQALRRHSPHIPTTYAEDVMSKADVDGSAGLSFRELVHYVVEHEKRLAVEFAFLDKNADGRLDRKEIVGHFAELGIPISEDEAEKIVEKVQRDGSASIDLGEFQRFLLFLPSLDPSSLAHFWKHSMVIDIGEDAAVPEDFSPSELLHGAWWRHLVAGAAAGAVSRTMTAPLDRLKVFLQVHASRANGLGFRSGLKLLWEEGGLRGLWRGNGVNVIKIAPESALKFMAYEQMKRVLNRGGEGEVTAGQRLLAGSAAGSFAQTIIYPLEVMKTRLALRKSSVLNRGLVLSSLEILRREGPRAFYKGYLPNILGIIPYAGIDLAVYETLKREYVRRTGAAEPGVLALLGCGAASSSSGMLVSYPLALVRTRLQAQGMPGAPKQGGGQTMVSQLRHIWANEGLPGFYRGLVPNYLKVLPAVSISYLVYETVRSRLGVTMS